MTFMTRIRYLCIVLYYILEFDRDTSSREEIRGPKVFKVMTL